MPLAPPIGRRLRRTMLGPMSETSGLSMACRVLAVQQIWLPIWPHAWFTGALVRPHDQPLGEPYLGELDSVDTPRTAHRRVASNPMVFNEIVDAQPVGRPSRAPTHPTPRDHDACPPFVSGAAPAAAGVTLVSQAGCAARWVLSPWRSCGGADWSPTGWRPSSGRISAHPRQAAPGRDLRAAADRVRQIAPDCPSRALRAFP